MKKSKLKALFSKNKEIDLSKLMLSNIDGELISRRKFENANDFYEFDNENNFKIIIDLDKLVAARAVSHNFGKIDPLNRTMNFGFFIGPMAKDVDESVLKPTGKTFNHGKAIEFRDQENGERIVRTKIPSWQQEYFPSPKKFFDAARELQEGVWNIKNWKQVTEGHDQFLLLILSNQCKIAELDELDKVQGEERKAVEREIIKQSFVISPELLKMHGVKNVDALTNYFNKLKPNVAIEQNDEEELNR